MKKLFLMLTAAVLFTQCFPTYQPSYNRNANQFKDKYADQLDEGSTLVKSGYNYTTEKTKNGAYLHKVYYPDTRQILDYDTYADPALKIKNGPSKSWSDFGDLRSEGQYANGKREGEWKQYWGKLTFGKYINDLQEGLWVTQDSSGNKVSETNYSNGKKHGPFKVWDKDGELVEEGNYEKGEVEWSKKHKETLIHYDLDQDIFKVVEKQPAFPGCTVTDKAERKKCADEKMLQFIYGNIKYPAKARENGIEGMAIIKFIVEKDGSISSVESVRGICNEIRDECIRIVKMMPKWVPGEQDGKPVRVQFNLPVKFKLE